MIITPGYAFIRTVTEQGNHDPPTLYVNIKVKQFINAIECAKLLGTVGQTLSEHELYDKSMQPLTSCVRYSLEGGARCEKLLHVM